MATRIGRNERSWVIDLISKINEFSSANNLSIKKAGGENTIRADGITMFPDILLYGDKEQSILLQGWEAKMPDVPIDDATFVADAQRKARALNLNSCVLWNFTYARLYVLNASTNKFELFKSWVDTDFIKNRADVQKYRSEWEELLTKIILELNQLFITGTIRESSIDEALSSNILSLLIARNKTIVATTLQNKTVSDARIEAYITNWWNNTKIEYEYDENNKYNAYAKNIILNWANRIIFAYAIKEWQNPARAVEKIDNTISPEDANNIFATITKQCDFFNIFSSIKYDTVIPITTWNDLGELSSFLKVNGTNFIDQTILQHVLENTVNSTKREINGLFTTPVELAKLLAMMTIKNWTEDVLDPCCGTGTIAREVLKIKKDKLGADKAVATVWASDKNKFPLQVANISMADHDTIFLPNRIFQHNALLLQVGETISIVNPTGGSEMALNLPEFGSIVSNLPFVAFENIPDDDKEIINNAPCLKEFSNRAKRMDLYGYIIVTISKLLKAHGQVGIITSNSWLGTIVGDTFVTALREFFNIKQVHISGKDKWFHNADVIGTIILLEKKSTQQRNDTLFYLWEKNLEEFESNSEWENKLVNSSLLEKEIDSNVVKVSRYSSEQIDILKHMNLSYNSFFHNVNWLLDIANKTIDIDEAFDVIRGSRRGWDKMFYPDSGHGIEQKYLHKVLRSAKSVKRLVTNADSDAFCCGKSIHELETEGSVGTIRWIKNFETQVNGKGEKLPTVLARKGMHWYELQTNEIVDIFTTMNPDKRLFFAKFQKPSFINQRLIGLKAKVEYKDVELEHALLNSVFTMFYIEASGFGRGLGALDIRKESIAKCKMLNPKLITAKDRNNILKAFAPLLKRDIKTVREELASEDRMVFEKTIMKAYGIEKYLASMIYSLLSMQNTRLSAKKTIAPLDPDNLYGYQDISLVAKTAQPYM